MRVAIVRRPGMREDMLRWMRQGLGWTVWTVEGDADIHSPDDPELIVHWLQSPAKVVNPHYHLLALRLEEAFPAVPTVNPSWRHLTRAECMRRMSLVDSPFTIPRVIEDVIVKSNVGRGGVCTRHGADIDRRVAIEYIDTRCEDGRWRKYRWVQTQVRGAPRHCIVSSDWQVHAERRIESPLARSEDIEFLEGGVLGTPDIQEMEKLLLATGYEDAAFDFSVDKEGRIVVWEANVCYELWTTTNGQRDHGYQRQAVEDIYLALCESYIHVARR